MESGFPNMEAWLASIECHDFTLHLILPEQSANFFCPAYKRVRSVFYNIDLTRFPRFAFVMLSAQLSFGGKERTTMKYIESNSDDFIECPTPAHLQLNAWGAFANPKALGMDAMGYGRKIRTSWKVKHEGKLYRVYATCVSNCASLWILTKGEKLFIRN